MIFADLPPLPPESPPLEQQQDQKSADQSSDAQSSDRRSCPNHYQYADCSYRRGSTPLISDDLFRQLPPNLQQQLMRLKK